MKNHVLCSVAAALALSVYGACVIGGTVPSLPGPPMICQPFDIGTASSLPTAEKEVQAYDRKKLIAETLGLLTPSMPVIVRMETLRRACILCSFDPHIARDLMLRLAARALDAEAAGKPDSLAWFDAGYYAASLSQLSVDLGAGFNPGQANGCDGYLWLQRAIATGKPSAGMEFGAALATHPAMHKGTHEVYQKHLQQAAALAEKDSVTEKNILAHCKNWRVELKKRDEKDPDRK